MFNLEAITLVNFRSYKGEHTFKFPKNDGLYFLTGKNLLEPALGANGAGKSTFLDAITWCLYGRTTRGLKASEILSWQLSAGAQVTVAVTVGEGTFKVKRSQKPNGLFIDGKPVDQKELETHLRLNYEAFTHSVLSPQFGEPFFSLSPAAKLTLFSDINGLDHWLEKSEEASRTAKKQEAGLLTLNNSISRLEGQLESTKLDIADLEDKSKNYKAERAAKIKDLEQQRLTADKQAKGLDAYITGTKKDKVDLSKSITTLEGTIKDWTKSRQHTLELIATLSGTRKNHELGIEVLRRELQELKTGKDCPTCGQPLKHKGPSNYGQHIAKLERDISIREGCLKVSKNNLKRETEEIVLVKGHIQSRQAELSDLQAEMVEIDEALSEAKVKIGLLDGKLRGIAADISELKARANPYKQLLDDKTSSLQEISKALAEQREVLEKTEADHIATSFWIKGFKRLRLFIIEQAFQTLEVEVNNSLAQLGMVDWQVTFDVERENKSGGITKGFVVLIKSPSNKEPVRWENWSGGETQRLQLAGDIGLSNLIMHQAGLENTIEFYDEPSTHLSPEGMIDLADMLHARSVSEGKRIWIVDHASITNFGEFRGIIEARKDEHGSSIVYEAAH